MPNKCNNENCNSMQILIYQMKKLGYIVKITLKKIW